MKLKFPGRARTWIPSQTLASNQKSPRLQKMSTSFWHRRTPRAVVGFQDAAKALQVERVCRSVTCKNSMPTVFRG